MREVAHIPYTPRRGYSYKQARRIHACNRARERYGLSPQQVKLIERQIKKAIRHLDQIKAGKEPTGGFPLAWRIAVVGSRRTSWRVRIEGEPDILVIFDEALERVITFLFWGETA